MKKLTTLTTLIALAAALSAPAWAATKTVTLSVPGMTCAACPITVKTLCPRSPASRRPKSASRSGSRRHLRRGQDQCRRLAKATANAGYPSSVKQ